MRLYRPQYPCPGVYPVRMFDRFAALGRTLDKHGQAHLLTFADRISEAQRRALVDQINAIDFTSLANLIDRYVRQKPRVELPTDPQPAPYYPFASGAAAVKYDAAKYRSTGEDLIRRGKIAAFTVAGGQGTRLGWNGP